jgi:hypothetical protein
MIRNRHARALALVFALATAAPLFGAEVESTAKTTLRWKFKAGEVLRYAMDQTTVSTGQDPEGKEMSQSINLVMDMTWTVKAVDPSGLASVVQTIDRIRTTATLPFGKITFDSKEAASATSAAGPLFKMLVGAEFTAKLSPLGEATDVKLSEKLLAMLREDEPAGAQGQFSEAGLKNIIAQMVTPLPEAGVDVGETWTKALAIPAGPEGQTRKIEQTFTYKGADPAAGGAEVIEFSTKFEAPKPDPNVQVTFKKEGATGRVEFDNAAGRIARSTVAEDVEYSMAFQGKDLAQKVKTSRVLTLSKDKAP